MPIFRWRSKLDILDCHLGLRHFGTFTIFWHFIETGNSETNWQVDIMHSNHLAKPCTTQNWLQTARLCHIVQFVIGSYQAVTVGHISCSKSSVLKTKQLIFMFNACVNRSPCVLSHHTLQFTEISFWGKNAWITNCVTWGLKK